MAKPFANSGDPDQKRHSVASYLGLHCLPATCLRVSGLQWVRKSPQDAFGESFLVYKIFSLVKLYELSLSLTTVIMSLM